MTEKIISIKLNVDTSDSKKLFSVTDTIQAGIDKVAESTRRLSAVERERLVIRGRIATEETRLSALADRTTNAVNSRSRGWNIAEANLARSIAATNARLEEQVALYNRLSSLSRNANNLGLGSTPNRTTAAASGAPAGFSYATGAITPQTTQATQTNTQATQANTSAVAANTTARHANNNASAESIILSRNLFLRAAELIGIYRVFNTVLQGVKAAILAIPRAGLAMQANQAGILGIFGTQEGEANLKMVSQLAMSAGQSLTTLEEAYKRFAPSAMLAGANQAQVNKVFKDFAEVATILHLPEEKLNALFLAIDQMYAKGVVQSEEVKKQLGNVLPGAVESFAIAMGKTPAAFMAAMKANEVIARDAVPKFAAYIRKIFGGEDDTVFTLVKDRLQSNLARLENVYTIMNRNIFENTNEAMNSVVKASVRMVEAVTRNLAGITQAVTVLADLILVRLAGAAIGLAITNFGLLATKLNAVVTLLAGVSAPVLGVGASLTALYGQMNDLNLAYTEANGLLVTYKDKQVDVTKYIQAFALIALEDLGLAYDALTNKMENSFGSKAGNFIIEAFVGSIDLAVDSVYKLAAAFETLNSRKGGRQESGLSMVEDFRKNLEALRTVRIEETGKDFTGVIDKAIQLESEATLAKLKSNGASYETVWKAVDEKRLQGAENIKKALEAALNFSATEISHIDETDAETAVTKVTSVYSTANKILEEKIKQYESASKQIIDTLEKNKNDLETKYALATQRKEVVNEEDKIRKIAEIEKRILLERETLEERVLKVRQANFATTEQQALATLNNLTKFEAALQWAESRNKKDAVSPTGALGLMQVQPTTAAGGDSSLGVAAITGGIDKAILNLEHKARVLHQKLTETEVETLKKYAVENEERLTNFGKTYFEALVKHFKGDMLKAAAAYNEGVSKASRDILTEETKQHRASILSKYNPEGEVARETHLAKIAEVEERIASSKKDQSILSNKLKVDTSEVTVAKREELATQNRISSLESQGYTYEAGLQKLILEYTAKKLEMQNAGLTVGLAQLDNIYKSKAADLELANLEEGLTTKQIAAKRQLLEIAGTAQQDFEVNMKKLDILYNAVDAKGQKILTQAEYITALGNINAKYNVALDKEVTTPIDTAIPALKRYEEYTKKATKSTRDFGDAIKATYSASLKGVNQLAGALESMIKTQAEITAAKKEEQDLYIKGVSGVMNSKYDNEMKRMMDLYQLEDKHAKSLAQTKEKTIINTLDGITQIAGATSQMFEQNSKEAKAFELIALGGLIAKAAAAMLTQGEGDPYTAFARIAAMGTVVTAILARAGAGGFDFTSTTPTLSKEQIAASKGAGTVLGDSEAVSQSITNVADLLKAIHAEEYVELRGINKGIQTLQGGITDTVTRIFQNGSLKSIAVNPKTSIGGGYDALHKINIDPIGNLIAKTVLGGLFGKTTYNNIATGIGTGARSVDSILKGGDIGAVQADVVAKTKKSWFGTTYSYQLVLSELNTKTKEALDSVFQGMGQTMLALSKELGHGLEDKLRAYIIPSLSVDLKGLSGEDASKKLNGVISAALDTMSATVFGDIIGQYQQLGEGMLETAVRVVSEVAVVRDALSISGTSMGENAIAIADALSQAAGGLENFQQQFETFYDKFYSDAEKHTRLTKNLESQLSDIFPKDTIHRLGESRAAYRQVLEALDLNTQQGREQYSMLIRLSSGADEYYTTLEKTNADATDAAKELLKTMEDTVKELFKSMEDAANEAKDAATKAGDALRSAYDAEASALKDTIDKVESFSKSLKDFRDNLVLGNSSILTPGEKYNEARNQYNQVKTTLNQGPGTTADTKKAFEEAMNSATGKLQNFLEASRTYNASGAAYTRDYLASLNDVNSGVAMAEALKTDAQRQLDKMTETVSALITINESVLSVADAITAMHASILQSNITSAKLEGATALNRALSPYESNWIEQQFRAGRSKEDIWAEANAYIKAQIDGSHYDGLETVPFDGYVAKLHKNERVQSASQVKVSDLVSQEILLELRSLREEVALLRADANDQTGALIQSNYDANYKAATKVVTGTKEATADIVWADRSKVVLS